MIPVEYSEFAATHHRMRGAWIVKPVASSRGRGIFIVSHPNQERTSRNYSQFAEIFRSRQSDNPLETNLQETERN